MHQLIFTAVLHARHYFHNITQSVSGKLGIKTQGFFLWFFKWYSKPLLLVSHYEEDILIHENGIILNILMIQQVYSINIYICTYVYRFHRLLSGKESACQRKRHKRFRFNPCVRKIPWRRKWQPIPVLLLGKIPWAEESRELHGVTRSWIWLSSWACTYMHSYIHILF